MQKLLQLLILIASVVCLPCLAQTNAAIPASSLEQLTNASSSRIKTFFNGASYRKLHRSNAEFLTDVYRGILQREPDEKGYTNWLHSLETSANPAQARAQAVETFLRSTEFRNKQLVQAKAKEALRPKKDTTRNPANVLFDKTGVFVNDAMALPAKLYADRLKKAKVRWIILQIDNGGQVRTDNVATIEKGWMDSYRKEGFKVGFWGAPRGIVRHNDEKAVAESIPLVEADAALAVKLTAQYHGDCYVADCEDGYQGYSPKDPAPTMNRIYVEAFERAAKAAGIWKLPRALSSMGRIALDMRPWIDAGWDAMPQAYWNSYSHYQPSKCVDFYTVDGGWPIQRVHPTIATFTSEGEKREVSLPQYAADLKTRATHGFSFYLPESYLRLDDKLYDELAAMER